MNDSNQTELDYEDDIEDQQADPSVPPHIACSVSTGAQSDPEPEEDDGEVFSDEAETSEMIILIKKFRVAIRRQRMMLSYLIHKIR